MELENSLQCKDLPWLEASQARLRGMLGALPHAMLLGGAAGLGQSLLADWFANLLLCEASEHSSRPCGSCPACGWFRQGNHPDFRRLAPEEDEESDRKSRASPEIKIAAIRAIEDFLSVGTHRSGARVIVIDPADQLNHVSANALLKTLEEPQPSTVFLLVSSRPEALPATVRSRCVRVPVRAPRRPDAVAWLAHRTSLGETEASDLLSLAGDSPLLALSLAEPGIAAAHRVILHSLRDLPDNPPMITAESFASLPARSWFLLLQAWVSDLGRTLAGAAPGRFVNETTRLRALAQRTDLARLSAFERWLQGQAGAVEHPLNARLFCESVLLRYTAVFREGTRS